MENSGRSYSASMEFLAETRRFCLHVPALQPSFELHAVRFLQDGRMVVELTSPAGTTVITSAPGNVIPFCMQWLKP